MNKKIIIFSILMSLLFSFAFYKIYQNRKISNTELYLLQIGAYKNYINAVNVTKNLDNYFILKEDDLYKVFVGLTLNEYVYDKLLNIYAKDYNSYKKVVKMDNDDVIDEIDKYDKLLINLDKKEEIDMVLKEEIRNFSDLIKSIV